MIGIALWKEISKIKRLDFESEYSLISEFYAGFWGVV